MTTSGFAEVDDQLERRPVAILQTAHLMRSFRRNPLGGGSNPSAPTLHHLDDVHVVDNEFNPDTNSDAGVVPLALEGRIARFGVPRRP